MKAAVGAGVPIGVRYTPAAEYPGLMDLGGWDIVEELVLWNFESFKKAGLVEAVIQTKDDVDVGGSLTPGREIVIECGEASEVVYVLIKAMAVCGGNCSGATKKK
jgi:hypothetical protein